MVLRRTADLSTEAAMTVPMYNPANAVAPVLGAPHIHVAASALPFQRFPWRITRSQFFRPRKCKSRMPPA